MCVLTLDEVGLTRESNVSCDPDLFGIQKIHNQFGDPILHLSLSGCECWVDEPGDDPTTTGLFDMTALIKAFQLPSVALYLVVNWKTP